MTTASRPGRRRSLSRRRADDGHRRRSHADTRVSRHQRCRGHHVVGPAVPRRAEAHPAERRRVLGCVARGAKSDRAARRRPADVGIAVRPGVVAAAAGRAPIDAQDIDPARGLSARSVAMRRLPPPKAPPTSASTSSISVSSSSCRRCCWPTCFSPSDSNSARAKSACWRRSASPRRDPRSFVREGFVLAAIGAIIGAAAAVGYGALIMYGLRTWWVGAVGTTRLELHVAPASLAAGVIGAFAAGNARAVARRARDEPPLGARVIERATSIRRRRSKTRPPKVVALDRDRACRRWRRSDRRLVGRARSIRPPASSAPAARCSSPACAPLGAAPPPARPRARCSRASRESPGSASATPPRDPRDRCSASR